MRRPLFVLPIAAALALVAGAALAAGEVDVPLNGSLRVPLHGSAAKVVVGDPAIADVSMTDAHSLILLGRGYGSTQVTVTDHRGRTLLASRVSVVQPDEGHITYYKGVASHEYTCAGSRCIEAAGAPAAALPAAPPLASPAEPAAEPAPHRD
jgi:hypothetical protein